MRKFSIITLFLAFLAAFTSCSDDNVVIEEPVQASNTQDTVKHP